MSDNISLPPTEIMDALGHRLAQASIDAASWQVAQQLTQQRGAEQIASLTEALNQRDQKVFAATRLIEEMLDAAEQDPGGIAKVTKDFLVKYCHEHGFPVQLPDSSPPQGTIPEPPADGGHDPYKFIRENSTPITPAADAGLDA